MLASPPPLPLAPQFSLLKFNSGPGPAYCAVLQEMDSSLQEMDSAPLQEIYGVTNQGVFS